MINLPLINIVLYAAIFVTLYSNVFFLWTFIENLGTKRFVPKTWPKVTIVVPAYNEEKTIAKTVESLLNLDYPKKQLQIIVVDDGSKDLTFEIASRYKSRGVEVYTKENGGKGSALNFALKHSKGEFFGALDADSFVAPGALKNIMCEFSSKKIMSVTAALKVYQPKTIIQKIQQLEYMVGVFLRKVFSQLNAIHVTPGPFSIYRKKFMDKYGGYDENNITEDIELALRIQKNDYQIKNAMNANVYTVAPKSFVPLLKQRVRWYLGFVDNVWDYRELFNLKYGILGVYILPMALISVALSIGIFTYSLYRLLKAIFYFAVGVNVINYDILYMIRSFSPNYLFMLPGQTTVLAFVLMALGFSMILIAKRKSEDKDSIKVGYFAFILAYMWIFSFWWISTIIYKMFGKNLKFGGVSWNKGIVPNLLKNGK